MRKKTFIYFLLPALFAAGLFFKTKESQSLKEPLKTNTNKVNDKKSAHHKKQSNSFLKKDMAQELLDKAKKKQKKFERKQHLVPKQPSIADKVTEGCPVFIKEVFLFEKHLRQGGRPDSFNFDQECPNLPLYGKAYEAFKKTCLQAGFQKNLKKFGAKCGQALFMLKATHAELTTKGVPLADIYDLEPLIYKYFYGLFGPEKRSSLIAISERVLELEPDLEEFKILSLISAFEAMVSKRPGLKAHHLKKMEEHFEDLLLSKEGREREGIYELKLLTLLHSKDHSLKDIESVLSDMESEVPNSSIALYYRANIKNQTNKREEAITFLKKAIELSPNEKRFQYTYKKLLTADKSKPAQNAFVFQLSFKGLPFDSL
ncbi:MAG: hypothetical protein CME68_12100 [Halobacteriovoraceae bacterium]|nr:hypothetical protein [Halobacteriovoraceae bacterium]